MTRQAELAQNSGSSPFACRRSILKKKSKTGGKSLPLPVTDRVDKKMITMHVCFFLIFKGDQRPTMHFLLCVHASEQTWRPVV